QSLSVDTLSLPKSAPESALPGTTGYARTAVRLKTSGICRPVSIPDQQRKVDSISQRFCSIHSCDTPSMFKDQIKNSSALSDCEPPSTKVHERRHKDERFKSVAGRCIRPVNSVTITLLAVNPHLSESAGA